MLLSGMRINTKHKLFLYLPYFPHRTHVEFSIFIQITRYNNNFKLHRLGEKIVNRDGVELGLVRLEKGNFYIFFLNNFRRIIVDDNC